jgi:hypothetical protein
MRADRDHFRTAQEDDMRSATWMALALVGVLAASCGMKNDPSSSALDDVPDADALTLEVTGGAAELGALAAAPALATAVAVSDWPATGNDLTEAQKRIAAVNGALRALVGHVEAVALEGGLPTPGGGTWYGPADLCTVDAATSCPEGAAASFRLWVGRGPLGYAGAFVLQARPLSSTDEGAFVNVAAGTLARGVLHRRGHGRIWLDLDNLKAAAAAYPGQGKLYGGFAAGRVAKAETLVLKDFTPDAGNPDWPAATVALRGFKTAAGTARVRVASVKDLVQTTEDTELGLAHVVWNAALGGRAWAMVTNYVAGEATHGDVPADSYFLGRACWAAGDPTTPVYKEWFLCPKSQGPAVCIADPANPGSVEIGTSWTQCAVTGDPGEYDPPAAAPGSDPAQVPSALPGEGQAGETPDAPPAEGDPLPTIS